MAFVALGIHLSAIRIAGRGSLPDPETGPRPELVGPESSMIDLHTHVLAGVDDGARNDDVARTMLSSLESMGYTHVVATPHLMEPLAAEYERAVRTAWERTIPIAQDVGIELSRGYEHMIAPGLTDRLRAGEASTMAGSRSVLVEFPFLGWLYEADRVLFEMQDAGYQPILAHPERYVEAHRRPDLVLAIAERGVALQLTIAAFVGVYGRDVQMAARSLLSTSLETGIAVVLATDAHSMGRRLTDVPNGLAWIERNESLGPAVIEWASTVVPAALLADEPVPSFKEWAKLDPAEPLPRRRSRGFSFRSLDPRAR